MRVGVLSIALTAALAVALAVSAGAGASTLVARNATNVTLKVDASGKALVSYTSAGKHWNVLASGAVDAVAPTPTGKQVDFKLDYSGPAALANTCGAYTGPPLAWKLLSCTAEDGSHWALQSWQRMLPNGGRTPNGSQSVWELRLSHWTGELPVLTVYQDWAYKKYEHFFGSVTFMGSPVYGFKASSVGNPLDTFGRNIYLDTFDSAYGKGWKREISFLTHTNTGTFCYALYPQGGEPPVKGSKYRATVIGPGVTPDVMWQAKSVGRSMPASTRGSASSRSS